MLRVHLIPRGALLVLLVLPLACAGDGPRYVPVTFPGDARDPAGASPGPAPAADPERAYVGDGAQRILHRAECPECPKIDAARREFFPDPYEALDAGLAPCATCRPLAGWHRR